MRRRDVVELVLALSLLFAGAAVRMRVMQGWAFAGSDSYAYLKLGDELGSDGRFALGPPPQPLEWYRRPLYPIFLSAVRHGVRADIGLRRIQQVQIAIDVLIVGLLVFLTARHLGGRFAGIVALSLAMLYPPNVPFACAVLTEPLSSALTISVIASLILGKQRPRLWFPVAAATVGLASWLRPDGPLLAMAFVPALLLIDDGWKERARLTALSLVTFILVLGAWPARNLARFGSAHLADGMVDRYGKDVPHYVGFWRWLQTWAMDGRPAESPQSCFYNLACKPTVDTFARHGAFLAPGTNAADERASVAALLALREREGVSQRVSDGFMSLARTRRTTHPWRVLVALPLNRAWHMWTAPQNEVFANYKWRPWRTVTTFLLPHFRFLSLLLFFATLLSGGVLMGQRSTRVGGAVILATLVVRTAVLAWTAFSLPRYLVGVYPLCFVTIGAAAGVGFAKASTLFRSATPETRDATVQQLPAPQEGGRRT